MRNNTLLMAGFVAVLLIGVAVVAGQITVGTWYCDQVRFPDIDARFDVLVQQCMVNTDSGWVPEDRYRVVP